MTSVEERIVEGLLKGRLYRGNVAAQISKEEGGQTPEEVSGASYDNALETLRSLKMAYDASDRQLMRAVDLYLLEVTRMEAESGRRPFDRGELHYKSDLTSLTDLDQD